MIVTNLGGAADGISAEARNAAKYPAIQTTTPLAKTYQVQIVNSAHVEMLCFKIIKENEKTGTQVNSFYCYTFVGWRTILNQEQIWC